MFPRLINPLTFLSIVSGYFCVPGPVLFTSFDAMVPRRCPPNSMADKSSNGTACLCLGGYYAARTAVAPAPSSDGAVVFDYECKPCP